MEAGDAATQYRNDSDNSSIGGSYNYNDEHYYNCNTGANDREPTCPQGPG